MVLEMGSSREGEMRGLGPLAGVYLQLWCWWQEAAGKAGDPGVSKVQSSNALQEAAHRLLLIQRWR